MIAPEARADAGMSLVELIVVVLVSSLLLGVLAMIFGNGLAAQQRATERDAATAQLNAVTASIVESVRNSVDTRVTASGQRLDAKVLGADGSTWECRAWQLQGGELRYSAGSTARPAVSGSWASLASGASGASAGGAAFEKGPGSRVSASIELVQGDTAITVGDGAVAQVVQTGGPACW